MTFSSTFFALLFALPLAVLLFFLRHKKRFYEPLSFLINIGRSFPFAILIVALIPFTRFVVGTSLGTTASIVPLTLAAIAFFARMIELSFLEIPKELIQAAEIMGSSKREIFSKVLLKESLPSLILGTTNGVILLVGYSAMAGLMGGGGLGKVAIQYGYYQFNPPLMIATVILLIIMVQAIQMIGNYSAKQLQKRRGLC
jgi:D-methionine transport system permease protein